MNYLYVTNICDFLPLALCTGLEAFSRYDAFSVSKSNKIEIEIELRRISLHTLPNLPAFNKRLARGTSNTKAKRGENQIVLNFRCENILATEAKRRARKRFEPFIVCDQVTFTSKIKRNLSTKAVAVGISSFVV